MRDSAGLRGTRVGQLGPDTGVLGRRGGWSGGPGVELQHTAQALGTLDRPDTVGGGDRLEQSVAHSLVRPLGVMVGKVLHQNPTKVPFSEGDDLGETLSADRVLSLFQSSRTCVIPPG